METTFINQLASHLDLGDPPDFSNLLGYQVFDPELENVVEEDPAFPGQGVPAPYFTRYQKTFTEVAQTGEFVVGREKVKVRRKSPLSGEIFEVVEYKDVYDDSTTIDAYFTLSGDNPVIWSQSTQADVARTKGGFSDIDPDTSHGFYSAGISWKEQERNLHTVISWIWRNQDNPSQLRKGWVRFWKRYFGYKTVIERRKWLFNKHIKLVVHTFNRFGIYARNDSRSVDCAK